MVLFFTALLVVSIVGMTGILALKRYELTSGSMILAGVRPGAHHFFRTLSIWTGKVLPALMREQLLKAGDLLVALAHYSAAKGVLLVEHMLERVLQRVREKTAPERISTGEVSPFLREVADHKKQILRRSRRRATIEQ